MTAWVYSKFQPNRMVRFLSEVEGSGDSVSVESGALVRGRRDTAVEMADTASEGDGMARRELFVQQTLHSAAQAPHIHPFTLSSVALKPRRGLDGGLWEESRRKSLSHQLGDQLPPLWELN